MNDLINRKEAIELLTSIIISLKGIYGDLGGAVNGARELIKAMPSVELEQKKGNFLGTEYDGYADGNPVYYEWKCSECGYVFEDDEPTYNFCPNCGADMRGE